MNDHAARRPNNKVRKRRSGSALTEFAVMLPLMVTVVLGCIDFGRFSYVLISVTNAARVGANYGATHSYKTNTKSKWDEGIETAVLNDVKWLPGFKDGDLIVMPATVTHDASGRRVRVVVGYVFETVVAWPFVEDQVLISRSVEMRSIR